MVVNLGLCISVFDVLEAEDPYVHPGEPNAFVKTKFRLIVMRPFEGEVLVGKISRCTEEGVHIDLDFFEDVLIPVSCLQPGTFFDTNEQLFVWRYQENDLYMDVGEQVRFRLLSSSFTEEAPVRKEVLMAAKLAAMNPGAPGTAPVVVDEEAKVESAPYRLVGSIAEDGLGLLSWWGSA